MKHAKLLFVIPLLLAFPLNSVLAEQETAYGWQLMTAQERAEHRQKMQSMKTQAERERYRIQHHEKMQQRAKQQGVTLPDKPRTSLKGMGMDSGGKGPGGGAGGKGR